MLEYRLSDEDRLIFQLYMASKSKQITRKRIMSVIVVPIMYFLLVFILRNKIGETLSITIIVLVILWLLLYPIRTHYSYRKSYLRHIREYHEDKNDRLNSIDAEEDCLFCKNEGSESRIKYTEIEKIVELAKYYFVYISKGGAIIFPKDNDKVNIENMITKIKQKTNVEVFDEKKWRWL